MINYTFILTVVKEMVLFPCMSFLQTISTQSRGLHGSYMVGIETLLFKTFS